MARSTDELIRQKIGTRFYCAPEVLDACGYSPFMGIPADIFAIGVCMFILAFGCPPFTAASLTETNYRIL